MPHPDPQAPTQPRNPLHGLTLEAVLTALVAQHGWPALAQLLPLRCFDTDPSIASSLKFLRRTPWARSKVESLYLYTLREQARLARAALRGQARALSPSGGTAAAAPGTDAGPA